MWHTALLLLAYLCLAQSSDLVTTLPGIGTPDTPTFAGFLPANPQYGAYLYYYFAESRGNPATDPLILWLQGGPGS